MALKLLFKPRKSPVSIFFFYAVTIKQELFPSLHAYPTIDVGASPMAHHRRNFSSERLSSMNGAGGSSTFGGFSQAAVVQFGLCFGQIINSVYNVLAQAVSKDGAHPIVFSLYRDVIATPILFAAAWYFDGGVRWPRQEDVPRVVAQGESARRRSRGREEREERKRHEEAFPSFPHPNSASKPLALTHRRHQR